MNKYESIYRKDFGPASLAMDRTSRKNERPLDELHYKQVFLGIGHSAKHLALYYAGTFVKELVWMKQEHPKKFSRVIAIVRKNNKLPLP